jgi:hypothetical protein
LLLQGELVRMKGSPVRYRRASYSSGFAQSLIFWVPVSIFGQYCWIQAHTPQDTMKERRPWTTRPI